jgi:retron-type reverse transcriptase
MVDSTKNNFLLNLNKKLGIAPLTELVKNSKNKDGKYGQLIQIIGSIKTLTFAYLSVKNNKVIFNKEVKNETLTKSTKKNLHKISKAIINGSYQFSPNKMIKIPKSGKPKLPPLIVTNLHQKIVQKAMDMVFNVIFEEIFLDCNHSFRPKKNCHSALKQLQLGIKNLSDYNWVIKGKIKNCFPSIPHAAILKGLRKKIDCPATIKLVKKLLSSNYVIINKKQSSSIKRNIGISPLIINSFLFSNIVLHELDNYVINNINETSFINKQRKQSNTYKQILYALKTPIFNTTTKQKLIALCNNVSITNLINPSFKKIYYT